MEVLVPNGAKNMITTVTWTVSLKDYKRENVYEEAAERRKFLLSAADFTIRPSNKRIQTFGRTTSLPHDVVEPKSRMFYASRV
ncbi:hypothetical protein CRI94_13685 [Longibacter salinarum]|uniref:Uncharacterized protein n=1 Tax=Longibacter salinarum TaxID=1850348 RepID=A0A2A8CVE3_9BACT|nr:hypothetical protein CRI94_13685 [Longibacter salinarum]